MCFLFHDWRWGAPRWVARTFVQYDTCTRCGKARVREVLL